MGKCAGPDALPISGFHLATSAEFSGPRIDCSDNNIRRWYTVRSRLVHYYVGIQKNCQKERQRSRYMKLRTEVRLRFYELDRARGSIWSFTEFRILTRRASAQTGPAGDRYILRSETATDPIGPGLRILFPDGKSCLTMSPPHSYQNCSKEIAGW